VKLSARHQFIFGNLKIYSVNIKKSEKKSGGKRKNAGRKSAFNEPTKTVAFRCPLSKVDKLKLVVKSKLSEWSVK